MNEIEKGIAIPNTCKYPWKEMEVGDSFFVQDEKMRNSISATAIYHTKRGVGKFTVRKEECGGIRVWRIS